MTGEAFNSFGSKGICHEDTFRIGILRSFLNYSNT